MWDVLCVCVSVCACTRVCAHALAHTHARWSEAKLRKFFPSTMWVIGSNAGSWA